VLTAVFAATIAVAQNDIKRILAYSTVSQLGFMMLGLGTGGVAVGMFHLITHAFFKALLFMGAGSVIHGCQGEQDIRLMGGLRKYMPVTFATYAVGMLALAGFPLLFSGFWSKDAILHAAHGWTVSHWPFYLGVTAALLTAFYMTRQVLLVFYGSFRGQELEISHGKDKAGHSASPAHESPRSMTLPLVVLAVFAVILGFLGTPAWPWFQSFLESRAVNAQAGHLFAPEVLSLMGLSAVIVFAGIGTAYYFYGRKAPASAEQPDPLEAIRPDIYWLLKRKYLVDELYEGSVIRLNAWFARASDWLDRWVWGGAVQLVSYLVQGLAWVNRFADEILVNGGFDLVCARLRSGGGWFSRFQDGQVQGYLRVIGIGVTMIALVLIWGCRAS
jgi:NADH-quinone oxidoreductase subunit L